MVLSTTIYEYSFIQNCCTTILLCLKKSKTKIKSKYGTTDPKELHNEEEYVNFRNEFLNGGGPLKRKITSSLYRTGKTLNSKS